MRLCAIVFVFWAISHNASAAVKPTMSVADRINIYKGLIKDKITANIIWGNTRPREITEDPDYVNNEEELITPVVNPQSWQKKGLRQLRTTTMEPVPREAPEVSHSEYSVEQKVNLLSELRTTRMDPGPKETLEVKHSDVQKENVVATKMIEADKSTEAEATSTSKAKRIPVKAIARERVTSTTYAVQNSTHEHRLPLLRYKKIFRRINGRSANCDGKWDTPSYWAHCVKFITPYLKGDIKELKGPGKNHYSYVSEHHAQRLVHLLSRNVVNYTVDDLTSLIVQINEINIVLYQWDYHSLTKLFAVLCPPVPDKTRRIYSFACIEDGLKNLVVKLHLDLRNVRSLIQKSRIVRPYCIRKDPFTGSTMSSKVPSVNIPKITTCRGISCSGGDSVVHYSSNTLRPEARARENVEVSPKEKKKKKKHHVRT